MIVLGLGSNIGDKFGNLQKAVTTLGRIVDIIRSSPVYKSYALLPENAPANWNMNYFNIAIACESNMSPPVLLEAVKIIEHDLGRTMRGRWGPREIDIDILAYGDLVIDTKDLTIPHKSLLERDFALVPLADVAPDWVYPVAGEFYGKTAKTLAENITQALEKTDFVIKL